MYKRYATSAYLEQLEEEMGIRAPIYQRHNNLSQPN
jgi:hypothetical protein